MFALGHHLLSSDINPQEACTLPKVLTLRSPRKGKGTGVPQQWQGAEWLAEVGGGGVGMFTGSGVISSSLSPFGQILQGQYAGRNPPPPHLGTTRGPVTPPTALSQNVGCSYLPCLLTGRPLCLLSALGRFFTPVQLSTPCSVSFIVHFFSFTKNGNS